MTKKLTVFKGLKERFLAETWLTVQTCQFYGIMTNIWGSFEAKNILQLLRQKIFNPKSFEEKSSFENNFRKCLRIKFFLKVI